MSRDDSDGYTIVYLNAPPSSLIGPPPPPPPQSECEITPPIVDDVLLSAVRREVMRIVEEYNQGFRWVHYDRPGPIKLFFMLWLATFCLFSYMLGPHPEKIWGRDYPVPHIIVSGVISLFIVVTEHVVRKWRASTTPETAALIHANPRMAGKIAADRPGARPIDLTPLVSADSPLVLRACQSALLLSPRGLVSQARLEVAVIEGLCLTTFEEGEARCT